MRLINADKLYPDCMTKDGTLAISQSQIANAPTIEINTNDIEYKAYCKGLEDGKKIARSVDEEIETYKNAYRIMSGAYEYEVTKNERPHVEWVPVSERLPDNDGGCYLVSLDNGQIVVADSGGIIENHDFEPRMLAWQPLPEPYKEGGKE